MIQLRLRERALLRQGQLFEPTASSGPAAMLLAISRNLSCIPRRSPCPERYPLPLALGFPSLSRNQQHLPMESLPGPISSPSGVRLSLHLTTQKERHPPGSVLPNIQILPPDPPTFPNRIKQLILHRHNLLNRHTPKHRHLHPSLNPPKRINRQNQKSDQNN